MKYCTHCGKEIADAAVICLSCGCAVTPAAPVNQTAQCDDGDSTLATWAMICGICSFFIGWFVLGIAAIIMAHCSKADTGGVMNPSAKTGYICGIISTVLSVALLILFVALITLLAI